MKNRINSMQKAVWCLFLGMTFGLGIVSTAFGVGSVTLSENQVAVGDSVELIFTSDKPIQAAPDLQSIQSLFRVGNQQQMSQTSVVNGQRTQTYQLIFTLFPKKVGQFKIGPFDFDGTQIPSQVLTVRSTALPTISDSAKDGGDAAQKEGVFSLIASLSGNRIYEGETAVYTVRLEEGVGLVGAEIRPPVQAGMSFERLGDDKFARTVQDGQSINVFERSFLITPSKTGTYTLGASELFGAVLDKNKRQKKTSALGNFLGDGFFFDEFNLPRKEVYLESNELVLTVLQKPFDWKGWWLPSTEVLLHEDYKIPDKIRVGDPLERHVLLSVKGVEATKLPLLTQQASADFKVYANPEHRQTDLINNQLVGTQDITFVLMPTTQGKLKIPSITLSWFNTLSGQKETAVLPSKEIDVLPSLNVLQSTGDASFKENESTGEILNLLPFNQQDVQQKSFVEESKNILQVFLRDFEREWQVMSGLLCIVLVGSVFFVFKRRKHKKNLLVSKNEKKKKEKPLPELYPF